MPWEGSHGLTELQEKANMAVTTAQPTTPAVAILRRDHVEGRTGLSRSSIYKKVKNHEFPTPISLGGRAVGWLEHEIDAWLDEQVKKSRGDK
ncbi:hypothetical protein AGMMS49543_24350 [Betaproteobacteria bacterium]|nr:hypothetical protein AGMMS49543_24350 [Betaproteobacteria bacterium]GHU23556.1 hypothetical protein AGMMS50243_25180 [Betaproteobacteria bacterium]